MPDIVICGAGITGVSAAYFLSLAGIKDILIVDEHPPLSFTSDQSAECYRNWWADHALLSLLNRSIDLLEDIADKSGNVFQMNRRGYLYITAKEKNIQNLKSNAELISKLGAGKIRSHPSSHSTYHPASNEDYRHQPDGADLLLDPNLIQKHFPEVTEKAVAALHVRRAGWLSAQQLGIHLLNVARENGVRFEPTRVIGVDLKDNQVTGVRFSSGNRVNTPVFINAAGPYLRNIGKFLGIALPVHTELHLKASIRDTLGVVNRASPLLIWNDPQLLPWNDSERDYLANDEETRWLTEPFPAHVHTRPEGANGSKNILMLWEYQKKRSTLAWPPVLDEGFPEIALRGLATMLPGMNEYLKKIPQPHLDGGYYTKTADNLPMVGPLPVKGAYVTGAVAGYGIMSSCGVGELLCCHIVGEGLPDYAQAFLPERFENSEYLRSIGSENSIGGL